MSKRLKSKYKIDRRLGVNLWGRPKSPSNNRDYPPGQHGQRRRKASDYGTQLMGKKKLKGCTTRSAIGRAPRATAPKNGWPSSSPNAFAFPTTRSTRTSSDV